MKNAHCCSISYGVETLNQRSLELCKKNQTISEISDSLWRIADADILNYAFYIIGFENETEDDIIYTSFQLDKLPIHRLRVTIATPFPGSEWHQKVDKSRLAPDLSKYDTLHAVILDHNMFPHVLEELRHYIENILYNSSGYEKNVTTFCKKFPEFKKSFDEFFLTQGGNNDSPARQIA